MSALAEYLALTDSLLTIVAASLSDAVNLNVRASSINARRSLSLPVKRAPTHRFVGMDALLIAARLRAVRTWNF
jgi:hypothetical protein